MIFSLPKIPFSQLLLFLFKGYRGRKQSSKQNNFTSHSFGDHSLTTQQLC